MHSFVRANVRLVFNLCLWNWLCEETLLTVNQTLVVFWCLSCISECTWEDSTWKWKRHFPRQRLVSSWKYSISAGTYVYWWKYVQLGVLNISAKYSTCYSFWYHTYGCIFSFNCKFHGARASLHLLTFNIFTVPIIDWYVAWG